MGAFKTLALALALFVGTPALAQTTNCTTSGANTRCMTGPSEGVDFGLIQPQPNFAGAAIQAYQAGEAIGAATQSEAGSGAPPAAEGARKGPDARELYVGCNLFLRGVKVQDRGEDWPVSGSACLWAAKAALKTPMADAVFRFCIPADIVDKPRAMAEAFLPYFQFSADKFATVDGFTMYLVAMKARWPCS